jgi:hypothetical protein
LLHKIILATNLFCSHEDLLGKTPDNKAPFFMEVLKIRFVKAAPIQMLKPNWIYDIRKL